MPKHVLLLGCGRSGTSIFGELFKDLQVYDYYSEPDTDLLAGLDTKRPIAVKVPRGTPTFPSHQGLSFPIDKLSVFLPAPRQIYWIIRHPLDAICSLKVGISRNWGHHPRPEDWEVYLEQPLILRCAHHWNYINTRGYEQVKELASLKHFEDLVLRTNTFAQRVCEELQIDPNAHRDMLQYWSDRVQNSNNEKFVEAVTSRPYSTQDHRVKVGRWQQNMSKKEYEMVIPVVWHTAKKFGYDLSATYPL